MKDDNFDDDSHKITGDWLSLESMVRKLNRPFLGFLTMNSGEEEPHVMRPVA